VAAVIKTAKAALVREIHALLINPIRMAAREKGYAIAVHGSLARDVDLIAVPWTEHAAPPQQLIKALLATVRIYADGEGYMEQSQPRTGVKKPHGRRAWSIHVDGTYFDISVMPRVK
jgi:hypothetical protein